MIAPFGQLVGILPATTVTLRTFAASTINARGEASAAHTDTSLTAVVHPTGRRTLERLGMDTARATISVYTTTAVRTVGSVRPARIQHQSRWYEVVGSGDYEDLGGIYLIHASLLDEVAA